MQSHNKLPPKDKEEVQEVQEVQVVQESKKFKELPSDIKNIIIEKACIVGTTNINDNANQVIGDNPHDKLNNIKEPLDYLDNEYLIKYSICNKNFNKILQNIGSIRKSKRNIIKIHNLVSDYLNANDFDKDVQTYLKNFIFLLEPIKNSNRLSYVTDLDNIKKPLQASAKNVKTFYLIMQNVLNKKRYGNLTQNIKEIKYVKSIFDGKNIIKKDIERNILDKATKELNDIKTDKENNIDINSASQWRAKSLALILDEINTLDNNLENTNTNKKFAEKINSIKLAYGELWYAPIITGISTAGLGALPYIIGTIGEGGCMYEANDPSSNLRPVDFKIDKCFFILFKNAHIPTNLNPEQYKEVVETINFHATWQRWGLGMFAAGILIALGGAGYCLYKHRKGMALHYQILTEDPFPTDEFTNENPTSDLEKKNSEVENFLSTENDEIKNKKNKPGKWWQFNFFSSKKTQDTELTPLLEVYSDEENDDVVLETDKNSNDRDEIKDKKNSSNDDEENNNHQPFSYCNIM